MSLPVAVYKPQVLASYYLFNTLLSVDFLRSFPFFLSLPYRRQHATIGLFFFTCRPNTLTHAPAPLFFTAPLRPPDGHSYVPDYIPPPLLPLVFHLSSLVFCITYYAPSYLNDSATKSDAAVLESLSLSLSLSLSSSHTRGEGGPLHCASFTPWPSMLALIKLPVADEGFILSLKPSVRRGMERKLKLTDL